MLLKQLTVIKFLLVYENPGPVPSWATETENRDANSNTLKVRDISLVFEEISVIEMIYKQTYK